MEEVETLSDVFRDGNRPHEELLCNGHLSDIIDPESYAGHPVMAYMQLRLVVCPYRCMSSLLDVSHRACRPTRRF
jgi:hypothetical protein